MEDGTLKQINGVGEAFVNPPPSTFFFVFLQTKTERFYIGGGYIVGLAVTPLEDMDPWGVREVNNSLLILLLKRKPNWGRGIIFSGGILAWVVEIPSSK